MLSVKTMRTKAILLALFLGGFTFIPAFTGGGKVAASGSAQITIESNTSVNVSENLELRFYVTPSGASVHTVGAVLNLTNLTYVSSDAGGSNFSFAGIADSSASSFEFYAGNTGSTGLSAKSYILKVVVKAASSAGTGSINFSSAEAYDNSGQPTYAMAASGVNRSVTIVAPSTPPPPPEPCPSGTTGTPPNCTAVPSGNTGSGSNGNSNTNTGSGTTATDLVKVPNETDDPNDEGQVLPKDEVLAIETASTSTDDPVTAKTASIKKMTMMGLVALAGIVIVLAASLGWFSFRKQKFVGGGHIAAPSSSYMPPTDTNVEPTESDNPDKKDPPSNDGPKIIYPQG